MRITLDDGDVRRDIQNLKKRVPAAATAAARAATKELAEQMRQRVRDMIPNEGGWYDIYRDSIKVNQLSADHWELTTTLSEVSPTKIPAATTLLWVSTGDDVGRIIAQHNPWSLDTLPAVKGGFKADMVIRPASESEVEFYRRKRLAERATVDRLIERQGEDVHPLDAELLKINGKVIADVPFLARRLEYGLGGFPRTPIWTRIDAEGRQVAKSKAVQQRGENVFASRWRAKK